MMFISTLLGIALFASASLQHAAMMPSIPDKVLTPGSSTAPAGCKLLASDKGFPSNETVKAALPNAIFKKWGTLGADWTVQAKTVKDVQAAVNFARDNNVRLSILATGHDFMGRGGARSGLRLDMSAYSEPIVFAPTWKCGDDLTPAPTEPCPVDPEPTDPDDGHDHDHGARDYLPPDGVTKRKFRYFKKRDGVACMPAKLRKRHEEVPPFNVIKPVAGQQAVARVNAGTYHEVFYNAADASGLFPMGAQHGGVGTIGGWAQAGGHNPFAREYGMMSDQILEYEVVTADGQFQKVSECKNPELFWALRGGGGGTFGVVTGATVKVYPTPPIAVGRFFVNSTSPKLWDAVAYFLQQGPTLREKYGVQGYFYVYHNAFQSVLHFPNRYATEANAKAALEPLKAKMDQLAGATPQAVKYYTYKSYKAWYDAEQGNDEMEDKKIRFLSWYDGSDGSTPGQAQAMENPMSVLPWVIKYPQNPTKRWLALNKRHEDEVMLARPMSRTYLDSRLLTVAHVMSLSQSNLGKLMNKTLPGIPNNHIRGFLYGGGKQAAVSAAATGLNPAWRFMTYHLIINAVPGDVRRDYDMSVLSKQFPDAGAYVNEASPGEPDWKRLYWGSNYARLERIKKKVDPKNVFWCSPCVGADLLTYDDERICPNKAYSQLRKSAAPQTYPNMQSKTGIASLPGTPGITNPLLPIIQEFLKTGKVPDEMPEFDENGVMLPPDHDHGEDDGHDHGGEMSTATGMPTSTPGGHDHGGTSEHDHGGGMTTAVPTSTPGGHDHGGGMTTSSGGHDHGDPATTVVPSSTPKTTTKPPATTTADDGHDHTHG